MLYSKDINKKFERKVMGFMNKLIRLSDNSFIPSLGQGTWRMGENVAMREAEIKALKHGINEKMNLIDTAEMYGDGNSELLIGEAIKDLDRSELYIVSKVYPHNSGRQRIFNSCNKTLERLGIEYLDLYLLHWRGNIPLSETVECMEELVNLGKIKRWGVSNFDLADMEELWNVKDGNKCVVNQVLYHLGSRGIEYDLLPWMEKNSVTAMAYCPIAQGGDLRAELLGSSSVKEVAKKYGITPIQVLLAFAFHQKDMVVIPKAANIDHVTQNAKTLTVKLDETDMALLDGEFPAPGYKTYLDIV